MILRLALLILLVPAFTGAIGPLADAPVCAQTNAVRVVVSSSDGQQDVYCVDGSYDSGLDALRATGLEVVSKNFGPGLGSAVCSIDGTGNDLGDCPGSSGHWHLWIYSDGEWSEAQRGADSQSARPGDVHGWVWTEGATNRPPGDPSGPCAAARTAGTQDDRVAWVWIVLASGSILAVAALIGRRRRR